MAKEITMTDAFVCLRGAPNFRDFGGYLTYDGRYMPRRRLFRSDVLAGLTPEDFGLVARLGIRLVCDLRGAMERQREPTPWPAGQAPEVLHMDVNADLRSGESCILDMLRESTTEAAAEAAMLQTYREIALALQPQLGGLFKRLANGDGAPLIIHCTAGKDRTGVLAAVIQMALGAPREHVIDDYLLTGRYRDPAQLELTIAELLFVLLGREPSRAVVSALASVRESYLEAALKVIEQENGSLAGYLAAGGVDAATLHAVRESLLAD